MNKVAIWLIRCFGFFVFCYGTITFVKALYWGRGGLHMRTYDGEPRWTVEWHAYAIIFEHERDMHVSLLLILSGALIFALSSRN